MSTRWSTTFLVTIFSTMCFAQGLQLKIKKAGSESSVAISSIKKITFPSNSLKVELKSASTETHLLSAISKMYFGQNIITGMEESRLDNISVFPNPIKDELHFRLPTQLANKTIRLKIISMDGIVLFEDDFKAEQFFVMSKQLTNGHLLNQGTYLIQLVSDNTLYQERIIVL